MDFSGLQSKLLSAMNPYILGITGTMGAGKSTATRIFEKLGAIRISADELARFYTSHESPIKNELVEIFGDSVLDPTGTPDRKFISSVVFQNKEKLQALTEIIHPRVRQKALDIIQMSPGEAFIAWEVPLLFESGTYKFCTGTLCVWIDTELAKERVIQRDGITEEEFRNRIKNQMDIKEKMKRSEFLIENNGTELNLEIQCRELFTQINRKRGIS
ncbi:MAG: dephospho-CoA kinase [Leptospiraceae bacterium]|nr:dephospho-CoA kinase [Leptospiraceae bacterium]